jgi:uncharacterized phage protein gp47/JayE
MAILTANDFAQQMIAQLRVLDPSVSAEIGTPERKIIDTIAQALAENQVDLTGLAGALDIDSKFGANLDRFTQLFGFARQVATAASGYVIFARNSPAPEDILIPTGTIIQSNEATNGIFIQYVTTAGGTIAKDGTSSTPVPVVCTAPGTAGNSAANTLTQMVGALPPIGVTSVTNPAPITDGLNPEDDNVYKVRFKNTVLRNLAGTEDQYLALAVSTAFTTKANVIGPVSKYQEYVQVPDFDDVGRLGGALVSSTTGGVANEWTTALSAIPYAQDIYAQPVPFVSNGQAGVNQYFYRQDVDWRFNYPPRLVGDAQREGQTTAVAPNFSFLNVFNPPTGTPQPGLQTMAPGDIILTEFNYLSRASRNSLTHNVTNAVDVFVDGVNATQATSIFLPGSELFTLNPTDAFYVENFRRDGEPNMRPMPGNFFTPLFESPLVSLPERITIGTDTYYLGVHYWLVHEIGLLGGSKRARDGIEWHKFLGADHGGQPFPVDLQGNYDPTVPYSPTGLSFSSLSSTTAISVENYEYDANALVTQGAFEGAKQITTDVLAHRAFVRYFKLDITVMYSASTNYALTNAAIGVALQAFMQNQFFGSVVQLSDLLDVVHQVQGVDNVRWSNDLPSVPTLLRVIECDVNGIPLYTPRLARYQQGTGVQKEIQLLTIPGNPAAFGTSDTFSLSWSDASATFSTGPVNLHNVTGSSIQTGITSHVPGGAPAAYSGITVAATPWTGGSALQPETSFFINYGGVGTPYLPSVGSLAVTQASYSYDSDFFLQDNELPSLPLGMAPGDTVPGVIIRPRTQNTFVRPGIG